LSITTPAVGVFSPTALRSARLKVGLTQGDLADKLGTSLYRVSCWELGKSLPRTDRIPALAAILGLDVIELFVDPPVGDLAEYARRLVADWPALDDEQRAELRAALAPVVSGAA